MSLISFSAAYVEHIRYKKNNEASRKKEKKEKGKKVKNINISKYIKEDRKLSVFYGKYLESFTDRNVHKPNWQEFLVKKVQEKVEKRFNIPMENPIEKEEVWDVYTEVQDEIELGKYSVPLEIIFLTQDRADSLVIKKMGHAKYLALIHHRENEIVQNIKPKEVKGKIKDYLGRDVVYRDETYGKLIEEYNSESVKSGITTLNRQVPDMRIRQRIENGNFNPSKWNTAAKSFYAAHTLKSNLREEPANSVVACDIGIVQEIFEHLEMEDVIVSIIKYSKRVPVGMPTSVHDNIWKSMYFDILENVLNKDENKISNSLQETKNKFNELWLTWTKNGMLEPTEGENTIIGQEDVPDISNPPQKIIKSSL